MDITHLQIFDASIGIAAINLLNTVANLFWMMRLKSIQANGEILRDLRDQSSAKDEIIRDCKNQVRSYKLQYHNLLLDFKKLQGEMEAMKKVASN